MWSAERSSACVNRGRQVFCEPVVPHAKGAPGRAHALNELGAVYPRRRRVLGTDREALQAQQADLRVVNAEAARSRREDILTMIAKP